MSPLVVEKPVRNHSSRQGRPILLVSVHSTASGRLIPWEDEETGTLRWFDNPASDASAHVVIPRTVEEVWRCVDDEQASWTIEGLNPISLNLEFVHRLPGSPDEEERVTESQLVRGAWQVAQWCRRYELLPERTDIDGMGIVGHGDIPPEFNTGRHWDPGPFFDWDTFIALVKQWFSVNMVPG